MKDKDKSIGALWLKEKNGKKYLTGVIEVGGEKLNIIVFRNTYKKEGSKQPDMRILLSTGAGTTSKKVEPQKIVSKKSEDDDFIDDMPY